MLFVLSAFAAPSEPSALAERRIGVGVGTSFPDWSEFPGLDRVGVRWQIAEKWALDPAIDLGLNGGSHSSELLEIPLTPSVAVDLTARRYLAHPTDQVHLAGLMGVRTRISNSMLEEDDLFTLTTGASAGLGVEVTPRPWLGVSMDADVLSVSWSRSTWGETTQTGWSTRASLLSGLSAMVHVYL